MCCYFKVETCLPKASIGPLLELSGFKPTNDSTWVRVFDGIPDADHPGHYLNRSIQVTMYNQVGDYVGGPQLIHFKITPHIGSHSLEQHANTAIMACVILQIAQYIADVDEATVTQNSLMGGCFVDNDYAIRKLAEGPRRMTQDDLCLGFRTVLHDGIQLVYQEEEPWQLSS